MTTWIQCSFFISGLAHCHNSPPPSAQPPVWARPGILNYILFIILFILMYFFIVSAQIISDIFTIHDASKLYIKYWSRFQWHIGPDPFPKEGSNRVEGPQFEHPGQGGLDGDASCGLGCPCAGMNFLYMHMQNSHFSSSPILWSLAMCRLRHFFLMLPCSLRCCIRAHITLKHFVFHLCMDITCDFLCQCCAVGGNADHSIACFLLLIFKFCLF